MDSQKEYYLKGCIILNIILENQTGCVKSMQWDLLVCICTTFWIDLTILLVHK